jgi:signal transduction histidine kinase
MEENRGMRAARERARPDTRNARVLSTAVTIAVVVTVFGVIVVLARRLSASNDVSTTTTALAAAIAVGAYEPILRRVRPLATRSLGGTTASGAGDRLLSAIARFEDPERALHDVATATRSAVDADAVVVWLDVDGTLIAAAVDPRDAPLDRPDGLTGANDLIDGGHLVVVPVRDGPAVIGALAVRVDRALRAAELHLLTNTAAAAAIIARTASLRRSVRRRLELAQRQHDELVALRTATGQAQLTERRRLERELHDTCQQRAVVVAGKLGLLSTADRDRRSTIPEVLDDLELLWASVERVVSGGSPVTLIGGGLTGALYAEAADTPVPTEIVDGSRRRYPDAIEGHVYACCLEAIRNAVAHGSPSRIVVRLDERAGWLCFEIDDDGGGFQGAVASDGRGLHNMRSRLEELGGRLSIETAGRGTQVRGLVPVEEVAV